MADRQEADEEVRQGAADYSALYFPGKYWYAAMSFVYDYGGQIARSEGRQVEGHAQFAAGARRLSPS